MKVIYPKSYSYPERTSSSSLAEERELAFINAGFHLSIYTPTPCRGISKEVRELYKSEKFKIEELYYGKLVVNRFALYPEGKNPLLRAFRYFLCCCIHAIKVLRVNDGDVIYISAYDCSNYSLAE